jgi:hypothetical protein
MSSTTLPSDEEFLDALFEMPANHTNPVDNDAFLGEMLEVFSKNKVIPDGEDPVEFCRAMFDNRIFFMCFL